MENNQSQPTTSVTPQTSAQPAAAQPSAPSMPTPAPTTTPATTIPATSPTSTPEPSTPIPMAPASKHASRFGMLFVILFILGVIFLGGTYYFISSQQKSAPATPAAPISNKSVEIQSNIHKLDEELQSVDTNSNDTDFNEADQELKNL